MLEAKQMLQEIHEKHNLNFTQIAKKLKINQSTIQRIATGVTKNCRSDNYRKIMDFYQNGDANKNP